MTQNPKLSEAHSRTLPDEARRQDTEQTGSGSAASRTEAGLSEGDARTRPSNAEKDPDNWTTGGETMTGAQASYLQTLSEEAGEAFDPELSKAEASKRIDELQSRTGRGRNH